MERSPISGRVSPSTSGGGGGSRNTTPARSAASNLQPNYGSLAVQKALEHLASIDLIELCSEAKVERCRATRDLRSCGRYVQHVLDSCGHASLCKECSQRCDSCPICRIPIPKNGNRLRPRLYCECIEAGLISKRCDERFQEKEDGDDQLTADVLRLYALFDVAMENNLVSLICHCILGCQFYVTDVCMDETAVSSDPVIAFLLDEVVVKDWCKRTFKNAIEELQSIYNAAVQDMGKRIGLLLKISNHLGGISSVLEVLESSFRGSSSAQVNDLQFLHESVLKAKQHADIMAWCIRNEFLENVRPRYGNLSPWRSVVRARKAAAIKRSWPDVANQSAGSNMQVGSLFIEDALSNLEIDLGHPHDMEAELGLASLQKDKDSLLRSKLEGLAGCYPFESLRVAVDTLFLTGSSDMVVAKQAIDQFLYYIFDRHWTMPDDSWRSIVDDFAATFGVTRHSLIESLTFYLLDDDTDDAVKEACNLLPEICGPSTHPKIAQVLLERGVPETALMVLRWSGHDGSQIVSLSEAVTAVRVRVECGLLTEAFMYQRNLWTKVKEKNSKGGPPKATDDFGGWGQWLETLVTEICCLCIKRNLVDLMIELPWDSAEEKHLSKCLLDCAVHDPSSTTGNLLVVYYLQRYRYTEAYEVDAKLQTVEQEFISTNPINEAVVSRMRSANHWRASLVAKSKQLMSPIENQLQNDGILRRSTPELLRTSDTTVEEHSPTSVSFVATQKTVPSVVLQPGFANPFKSTVRQTQTDLGSPPVLRERRSFDDLESGSRKNQVSSLSRNLKFDDVSTPAKETNRSSNRHLHHYSKPEENGFLKSNGTPLFSGSNQSKKHGFESFDDPMELAWSNGEKASASASILDDRSTNGRPRWRSDDASDEDDQTAAGSVVSGRVMRRVRAARR
ncbi:E3 ubiquitin-protein ligase HOS1 [Linum perenne]